MIDFHSVSLSGGKDSTALLLLMLDKGMPIDVVIFSDTGMEFPEMYRHIERVDSYLYKKRGTHIVVLRHPHGFEWLMFDEPKTRISCIENRKAKDIPLTGNGWPGPHTRWCTGYLKTKLIAKALQPLKKQFNIIQYIGIAEDESHRCKDDIHVRYPLVELGITESKALQLCYDHGFDWDGLYRIYNRCSCWCCPLQRIGELRQLRKHHPDLWKRLLDMDKRAIEMFGDTPLGRFKGDWTVEKLDDRFLKEEMEESK